MRRLQVRFVSAPLLLRRHVAVRMAVEDSSRWWKSLNVLCVAHSVPLSSNAPGICRMRSLCFDFCGDSFDAFPFMDNLHAPCARHDTACRTFEVIRVDVWSRCYCHTFTAISNAACNFSVHLEHHKVLAPSQCNHRHIRMRSTLQSTPRTKSIHLHRTLVSFFVHSLRLRAPSCTTTPTLPSMATP